MTSTHRGRESLVSLAAMEEAETVKGLGSDLLVLRTDKSLRSQKLRLEVLSGFCTLLFGKAISSWCCPFMQQSKKKRKQCPQRWIYLDKSIWKTLYVLLEVTQWSQKGIKLTARLYLCAFASFSGFGLLLPFKMFLTLVSYRQGRVTDDAISDLSSFQTHKCNVHIRINNIFLFLICFVFSLNWGICI